MCRQTEIASLALSSCWLIFYYRYINILAAMACPHQRELGVHVPCVPQFRCLWFFSLLRGVSQMSFTLQDSSSMHKVCSPGILGVLFKSQTSIPGISTHCGNCRMCWGFDPSILDPWGSDITRPNNSHLTNTGSTSLYRNCQCHSYRTLIYHILPIVSVMQCYFCVFKIN